MFATIGTLPCKACPADGLRTAGPPGVGVACRNATSKVSIERKFISLIWEQTCPYYNTGEQSGSTPDQSYDRTFTREVEYEKKARPRERKGQHPDEPGVLHFLVIMVDLSGIQPHTKGRAGCHDKIAHRTDG